MKLTGQDILGIKDSNEIDPTYEQFETPLPNLPCKGDIKSTVHLLKTRQSKLYRQFFPKIYAGVEKYHDWRIPHLLSAMEVTLARQEPKYVEGWQAHINLLSFALEWQKCQTPNFFVTKPLLEAVQQTGIPDYFDFSNLKLPFPALIFTFPKGSSLSFKGRRLQYLGITYRKGSIDAPSGVITAPASMEKIIITTSFYPNSFFAPGYKFGSLNDLVKMNPEQFWAVAHEANEAGFDQDETVFTLSLLKLALSLVLAMEAKPDLVEREKKLGVMTTKSITSELWSPNVLGRKFRTQSERGIVHGTHASPRAHWRRGHFRQQGIGHITKICMNCNHEAKAHHYEDKYCQLPDCGCLALNPQTRFSGYITHWIEPRFVNAN